MGESTNNITKRHIEVLKLVGSGKTNKEIGSILNISRTTVNGHLLDIKRLLNVPNRTSCVILALKRGYMTLEDIDTEGLDNV